MSDRLPATEQPQLDDVLAALRDVLGDDLAGAYLHGSAVLGGLRPHGDLDVFAFARSTRNELRTWHEAGADTSQNRR